MPGDGSVFSDPHTVDEILRFLVHDREFLLAAAHLLTADDFKKIDAHEAGEREWVAGVALRFWNQYREPVGKLLRVELVEWARSHEWKGLNKDAATKRLLEYGSSLMTRQKMVAVSALLLRVKKYKMEHKLSVAMATMQDLILTGTLTPDQFLQISRGAVEGLQREADAPVDLFDTKELERRIARRILQQQRQRFPVLLVDPVDRLSKIIARKHLGLIMAPSGRGKTLFFVWLALAYALQGLNVLHVTLEDPKEDIEDRFDAAVTLIPLARLGEVPNAVRERFIRYKRLLRTRLKVYDGTDGATTIGAIESLYETERNRGFTADAVIVDYDDEIRPVRKQEERRMEFADIYRDYRAFLARHQLIGWIASQTGRKTGEMKIIRSQHIAEDMGKIRKASFVMSLGQGDWGEDSIFCWIEKHRYDVQHVGANIITDKARMLFYERDATLKREKIEAAKAQPVVV